MRRLGAATVFALTLVGLCVWFGTLGPAPAAGVYPENDAVVADPGAHVGAVVDVHGRVVATDPVTIRLTAGGERRLLEVQGVETAVEQDDVLAVYGRLETPTTVRARATVATGAGPYVRTRLLSLVAGLAVVGLGARYWTVDVDELALVRRDDSETRDEEPEGGETDA